MAEALVVAEIEIGLRTVIGSGVQIADTVLMGADLYETAADRERNAATGIPDVGIGAGTVIRQAIVDKNARIGANCIISPEDKPEHEDGENYYIREGIVIVPKNAVIPDGTVI